MNASGRNITKLGAGTVAFQNVRSNGLSISAGNVRINPKASSNSSDGTSVVKSLSITAGSSLDLTNNALVMDYTTLGTLLSDTRAALQSGKIKTSANDNGHALGYADNATLGKTSFAGQTVDATSLLVAYTYAGDANLDGTVNALDFAAISSGFGSGTVWTKGDFNYDGVVDASDFAALSQNFGKRIDQAPLGSVVPEPALLSGLMAAGIIPRIRRGGNRE